jgi:hypothetical protein
VSALPVITGADLPPLAYAHGEHHDVTLTAPEYFRPIAGSGWVKPDANTGMWTSPVTATGADGEPTNTAWLQYCRDEQCFASDCTRLTEIAAEPGARVLRVHTYDDLAAVTRSYPAASDFRYRERYPDWVRLAADGWDAFCLTDAGQWSTRLTSGADLYGWDCATVLWLRPAYTVGRTVAVDLTAVPS